MVSFAALPTPDVVSVTVLPAPLAVSPTVPVRPLVVSLRVFPAPPTTIDVSKSIGHVRREGKLECKGGDHEWLTGVARGVGHAAYGLACCVGHAADKTFARWN